MNKKSILLLVFLYAAGISAYSQHSLKVNLNGNEQANLLLYRIYGDKFQLLDTLERNKEGQYSFLFPSNASIGMYRLSFAPKAFADIIYNQEDCWIRTELKSPMDSMYVIQSVENQIYYDFLKQKRAYELKMELLKPLLAYYPEQNTFLASVTEEFETVQLDYLVYVNDKLERFPNTWASLYLAFFRNPLIPAGLSDSELSNFMQLHLFDFVNFDHTELLYSDAYPARLIEYLSLFSNMDLSREEMGEAFKQAIDRIMAKPIRDPIIRDFMIGYLMDGFQQYGFDEVIVHMAYNYQQTQTCDNELLKSDLQTRLENFQRLAIGMSAPDFTMSDSKNHSTSLSSIKTPRVILFFWSSTCPHCRELYPYLVDMYENQKDKKVEVVAISIDDDLDAWKGFKDQFHAGWIDLCDGKSWESAVIKDYNIYATPSFFVIDQASGKIVGKPILQDELKAYFMP